MHKQKHHLSVNRQANLVDWIFGCSSKVPALRPLFGPQSNAAGVFASRLGDYRLELVEKLATKPTCKFCSVLLAVNIVCLQPW